MKNTILERFLRYVTIDTQSDPASDSCPSTPGQLELGQLLVEELQSMGINDAHLDKNGYVMAGLPANTAGKVPAIGFIAHLDTSPDMSGHNVRPVIHNEYNGKDILLNSSGGTRMRVSDFPVLKQYIGQTLITSDGTTLLGADNKAGLAAIMSAIEYLTRNPDVLHGTVRIAFTPDEEIGKGADHFDVKKFGADFAYTVDGGELGELQFENFNAAHANIRIRGRNIHPGDAKDKMINAALLGMEYDRMLPEQERPVHTTGYEGFYHLLSFKGSVETATMEYIIRDHDNQRFEQRKSKMRRIVTWLNEKYGKNCFSIDIKDQYYNMRNKLSPVMEIVDLAQEAMQELKITPLIRPIRGGTDGARLSYMGLPCPNLFAGGHNFHGRYEFVPLESIERATEVILAIIQMAAKSSE
jgi:tripeptide aminopeptidase